MSGAQPLGAFLKEVAVVSLMFVAFVAWLSVGTVGAGARRLVARGTVAAREEPRTAQ